VATGAARVGRTIGGAMIARIGAAHPGFAWTAAFLVLLALPLLTMNGYQQYLLDLIMINIVLAVGLNIVKGFAGQVNVGHVALAAIGAYTSAVLTTKFGLSFWFALPLATMATGLVGIVVGVPSFRLEGAYLALATLGLAESVRTFIAVTDYLGGSIGYGGIPSPTLAGWSLYGYSAYYYVVMPAALAGTFVAFSILRSDIGRALKAIREDPLAAAVSGINVRKYKLLAFVISALYAGCAGSLAAHMAPGFIHPDDYNLTRMVTVILMVVIGGLGHVWGGVIGAALITIIAEWTRAYYQYEFIIFGMIVVLTMMYLPRGLGGFIDRWLATRRFVALREARPNARAA
jgi:branched-chain amino acid transport system permease protein